MTSADMVTFHDQSTEANFQSVHYSGRRDSIKSSISNLSLKPLTKYNLIIALISIQMHLTASAGADILYIVILDIYSRSS